MANVKLPSDVRFIIDRLVERGYAADVVGGAVRDMLLGREISDYDVTTSARPEEIKAVFADVRTIDTGIEHGTVTVHIDGSNYEVTTYRVDGEYKDGRHPETVQFTRQLVLDLSRRDFTINAMCYSPERGFTDLFGGRDDLEKRTVRTVGDATERFREDALRILRALRFASVLDFDIEESTAAAVRAECGLLRLVSRERIYTEWYKLLRGAGAYRIIGEYPEVIRTFIPELERVSLPRREDFLSADAFTRMLSVYYCSSSSAADAFERSAVSLKTDKHTRELGKRVLTLTAMPGRPTEEDILLAISDHGVDACRGAVALGVATGKYERALSDAVDRAIATGKPYALAMLAVTGNDIRSLGISGEKIGAALHRALAAVIRGECKNDREEILALVASDTPNA